MTPWIFEQFELVLSSFPSLALMTDFQMWFLKNILKYNKYPHIIFCIVSKNVGFMNHFIIKIDNFQIETRSGPVIPVLLQVEESNKTERRGY